MKKNEHFEKISLDEQPRSLSQLFDLIDDELAHTREREVFFDSLNDALYSASTMPALDIVSVELWEQHHENICKSLRKAGKVIDAAFYPQDSDTLKKLLFQMIRLRPGAKGIPERQTNNDRDFWLAISETAEKYAEGIDWGEDASDDVRDGILPTRHSIQETLENKPERRTHQDRR